MTIKIPNFRISSPVLILIMAVFFTSVLNLSFWHKMLTAVDAENNVSLLFILSLPIAMVAIFFIIFSIISLLRIEKLILPVLIPLSALANYAGLTYGVVIDNNMIANIMETTNAEASSYFNAEFVLWFFVTGVFPVILLFMTQTIRPSIKNQIATNLMGIVAAILVLSGIAAVYSIDYMAIMRNNKGVEKNVVPTYFMSSAFVYFKSKYINDKIIYTQTGLDAHIVNSPKNHKKNVVVFVLGETARSQNYELNGYNRPTNAHTRDLGVISFQDVSSCGTATAVSVPCMFSFMGHENYHENIAKKQSNVIDIINQTGFKTLWVENDEGCKDVCLRIPTIITDKALKPYCDGSLCHDDIMMTSLDSQIKAMADKGGIIVLHIMGSHGPTYYMRYTEDHKKFMPDCPRSDIQNCSADEIVNTYDNTILFTDFILSEVIKKLKAHDDIINPSVLYVSDHGESLGKNGIYLHGMPYSVAPKEQTQVPLIFWTTPISAMANDIDLDCLQKNAQTKAYSHDFLSHSLLGLIGIDTKLYNPELDIFKQCRT